MTDILDRCNYGGDFEESIRRLLEEHDEDMSDFCAEVRDSILSEDRTFWEWGDMAGRIYDFDSSTTSKEKRLQLSRSIFETIILEEEHLEKEIRKAKCAKKQKALEKLETIRDQKRCSLGRDANNFGRVLLDYAYDTQGQYDEALSMFLVAYKSDLRGFGPKRAQANPAYTNVAMTRMLQANQVLLEKGDYLSAFILTWNSIELVLNSCWASLLFDEQPSDERKLKGGPSIRSVKVLNFLLYLSGFYDENIKAKIDETISKRNEMLHRPSKGISKPDARQCIELAMSIRDINWIKQMQIIKIQHKNFLQLEQIKRKLEIERNRKATFDETVREVTEKYLASCSESELNL